MDARSVMSLAAVILATAVITYWIVQPSAPHNVSSHEAVASAGQAKTNAKLDSVANLVGGLETRLQENPEDAKGWLLLAKSYDHLGDNEKALRAYTKAVELGLSDTHMEMKLVQTAFDEDRPQ